MFDRIAGVYDLMNTAMTAGLHHRWRERAADLARVGPGSRVLDVATGTGDLALELAGRVAPGGEVVGSDFAEGMLARARSKAPAGANVRFEWADALSLPYPDATFDAATVGFGARNFSDLGAGLAEMRRVVRPGGRVVVLEITTPTRPPLSVFYRVWFDRLVPLLGAAAGSLTRAVSARRGARGAGAEEAPAASANGASANGVSANGASAGGHAPAAAPGIAAAYTYLPSSVKRFPGPEALAGELDAAGLSEIGYLLLAGGIVAIHAGTVPAAAEEQA